MLATGKLVGEGFDHPSLDTLVLAMPGSRRRKSASVSLLMLLSLLSAAELSFESERRLEGALQLFRKGSADFADCLHIALATQAGEQPLWTFDKGAAMVSGAQLLVR